MSQRSGIIDQDGEALWLYLTGPGELAPASDCWLANVRSSDGPRSTDELRASGSPPPAPDAVIDDGAGNIPAAPEAYSLVWSADGEAVQALFDQRPIAFLVAGHKRGFHIALRVDCPWGRPFDWQLYSVLFD